MQIVILEYSDGKVIRVNLNEQQEADYHDDADAFMSFLSELLSFRLSDVHWMEVMNEEGEVYELSDLIG